MSVEHFLAICSLALMALAYVGAKRERQAWQKAQAEKASTDDARD